MYTINKMKTGNCRYTETEQPTDFETNKNGNPTYQNLQDAKIVVLREKFTETIKISNSVTLCLKEQEELRPKLVE